MKPPFKRVFGTDRGDGLIGIRARAREGGDGFLCGSALLVAIRASHPGVGTKSYYSSGGQGFK